MAYKFSNSAATLALGMAFFVTPALLGTTSPIAIDSAFAEKGGNKNNNNNNKTKAEKSNPAKAEGTEKGSKNKTAKDLGALNAAHATTKALANAAPNSRVGKIAAYRDANAAAEEAAAAAAEAEAKAATAKGLADAAAINAATAKGLADAAAAAVLTAQKDPALALDPTNVELLNAIMDAQAKAALADKALAEATTAATAAAQAAKTAADEATAAAVEAAAAETLAVDALNAAANKTVTPEVRAEVNALLVGK